MIVVTHAVWNMNCMEYEHLAVKLKMYLQGMYCAVGDGNNS